VLPTRSKFLFLEYTQQLRLQLKGNVTDFVEEQRAAMGHLEAAIRRSTAPVKRSAFMTE